MKRVVLILALIAGTTTLVVPASAEDPVAGELATTSVVETTTETAADSVEAEPPAEPEPTSEPEPTKADAPPRADLDEGDGDAASPSPTSNPTTKGSAKPRVKEPAPEPAPALTKTTTAAAVEAAELVLPEYICHTGEGNGSNTNPYQTNSPNNSGQLSGHLAHAGDGPWFAGADKATFDFGDIIPPVPDYPGLENGLNWGGAGQVIWEHGCNVIQATPQPPSVDPASCDADGTLTLPNITGVHYEVSPAYAGAGTYTVTATPEPGYYFGNGSAAEQTVVYSNIVVPAQSDNCVTPEPPSTTPPTCDADGGLTLPTTEGVEYSTDPAYSPGDTGSFLVIASLADGYQWATSVLSLPNYEDATNTVVYEVTVDDQLDCTAPEAPALPQDATCESAEILTLPTTDGVVYTTDPVYTEGDSGTFTVIASLEDDWYWDAESYDGWTYDEPTDSFSMDVQIAPALDCVAPEAPSASDPVCGEAGVLTLLTTDGVVYTTDPEYTEGDSGEFTVIASLAEGKTWDASAYEGWTYDEESNSFSAPITVLPALDCVVPEIPETTDPTCDDDGTVTLPQTDGVSYAVEGTDDPLVFEVTATLEDGKTWGEPIPDGYEADGEGGYVYTITVEDDLDCTAPEVPLIPQEPTCDSADILTLPQTDGVVYTTDPVYVEGDSGQYTIIATLEDGWNWDADVYEGWTYDEETNTFSIVVDVAPALDCVAPVVPTVADPTCDADGTVVLPQDGDVVYSVEPTDDPLVFTVVAELANDTLNWALDLIPDGFVESGDGFAYEISVEPALDCVVPDVPADPESTCDAPANLELPVTPGVVYSVEPAYTPGDTGFFTVTAALAEGHIWDDSVDVEALSWEVELEEQLDCEEAKLPDTGGSSLLLLLGGGLLAVFGALMIASRPARTAGRQRG